MPRRKPEPEQVNQNETDLLHAEVERLREQVAKCFDRINDNKDQLSQTKEKVFENTISDLKTNEGLKAEIRNIAGNSGGKQGGKSGKVWGLVAGAIATAIIKVVFAFLGG